MYHQVLEILGTHSFSEFRFLEILIHGDKGRGYIRVDWYTPDALPNWGDGRLTILGTEGYIDRKYVDLVGRDGTDHIFELIKISMNI